MRCASGHSVCRRAGLWRQRIQIDGIPRIVGHGGVMGGLLEDGGEAKFARVVSTGDSRRVFVVVVAGCWYSDCGRVSRSWFTFSGCGIGPKICSMYDPTRSDGDRVWLCSATPKSIYRDGESAKHARARRVQHLPIHPLGLRDPRQDTPTANCRYPVFSLFHCPNDTLTCILSI